MLRRVGLLITSKIGAAVTLLVFAGVLAMGVVGSVKIYKDFKLEWFFPDDSYVNVFFQVSVHPGLLRCVWGGTGGIDCLVCSLPAFPACRLFHVTHI